jgi:hypothetical protein
MSTVLAPPDPDRHGTAGLTGLKKLTSAGWEKSRAVKGVSERRARGDPPALILSQPFPRSRIPVLFRLPRVQAMKQLFPIVFALIPLAAMIGACVTCP